MTELLACAAPWPRTRIRLRAQAESVALPIYAPLLAFGIGPSVPSDFFHVGTGICNSRYNHRSERVARGQGQQQGGEKRFHGGSVARPRAVVKNGS